MMFYGELAWHQVPQLGKRQAKPAERKSGKGSLGFSPSASEWREATTGNTSAFAGSPSTPTAEPGPRLMLLEDVNTRRRILL